MPESLPQRLRATSDFLCYLGKYEEANALVLLARLLDAERLTLAYDLEAYVLDREAGYDPEARPA